MATGEIAVGLFGIGLDVYWGQYAGLLERLQGYQAVIHGKLERSSIRVVDVGIVDTAEKAREAALAGTLEGAEYLLKNLGPLHPEYWPGGVPEGLPFLPAGTAMEPFPEDKPR